MPSAAERIACYQRRCPWGQSAYGCGIHPCKMPKKVGKREGITPATKDLKGWNKTYNKHLIF